MWALRILTGPQAGQMLELKTGRNIVGRAPQCAIKLISPGVSKEHTDISVYPDKIVITDLKSSNGTYLNGIRIQNGILRLGDKLGIHDILVDIIPAPEVQAHRPQGQPQQSLTPAMAGMGGGMPPGMSVPMPHQPPMGMGHHPPMGHHPHPGMMAPAGMAPTGEGAAAAPAYQEGGFKGLMQKANDYLEKVALPGVYKIPQFAEFKFVLLGFVVLFIFSTTLLSMIPMVQITRASIINESKRRAASIARTVATMNQTALIQNSYSSLTTNAAEAEEGVKQVLIIQQSDGMILAPASRAGTTPDLPFVHTARREMRPQSVTVDSSTIGASFPIGLFDPNTGEQSIRAHAIVLYDIGSLAFDDGRAVSLFMQTLVIACLLGLIVFYFMYKLIEYPITAINRQLDAAMREKTDNMSLDFIFPAIQALIGNINSLLTRYVNGDSDSGSGVGGFVNRDGEAENLTQMIGFPCVAISKEGRIISSNHAFLQVARFDGELQGQPFTAIPDVALQQNIDSLLNRAKENMRVIHTDQLEFSGHLCILSCQAIASAGNDADYYLITVSPAEGGN